MKQIALFLYILLAGCASTPHFIQEVAITPVNSQYEKMTNKQLADIDSEALCDSFLDPNYNDNLQSSHVFKELHRRGYRECSANELYCIDKLGFKVGTQSYANCRMQRDQYDLTAEQAEQNANFQNEMVSLAKRPTNVYIHHTYY